MSSALRTFALTLAATAILLRAILPAGWMPNTDGVAGTPLVICTVDGLHHTAPPHDPAGPPNRDHGFACPFAAAAHLAPPGKLTAVMEPASAAWRAPLLADNVVVSIARRSTHIPRGPPVSA